MGDAEPATRKDPTLSAFSQRRLGRYEILTQIGKGGMAEVHLAMQRGPGGFEKLVVIKLIHAHLATKQAFVDMLLEEGRLAGMIKHPNVVDIYDLGEADGRYYVAMEYLDGEPLLAILRRGVEGKRLDALSTARVIADTAEGLEAAHRLKSLDGKPLGLIHHDVSLGNIVVLYNGQVKLVDFGVAKARTQGKQELVQGKFGYMAPEKMVEGAEIDRRSDIWSLGVVAWEALTLQRLFKAKTDAETMKLVLELEIPPPSKVNPDVPAELDPIILRALERDPEKRASTAKGLALDIESVLRKKGYAGKNDRIAGYMETTFVEQIKVRQQLVAELSAGRTSKATIDAFRDAHGVPITPVPGSLTGGMPAVVAPELSDGLPGPEQRSDASAVARRESIKDLQDWVEEDRKWRALPWWKRYAPFLAGGFVLVVLVVVLLSRGGSKAESKPGVASAGDPTAGNATGTGSTGNTAGTGTHASGTSDTHASHASGTDPSGTHGANASGTHGTNASDSSGTSASGTNASGTHGANASDTSGTSASGPHTSDTHTSGTATNASHTSNTNGSTGPKPTGTSSTGSRPTGTHSTGSRPTGTNVRPTGTQTAQTGTKPTARPGSAEGLYKLGMDQLRRGDGKGALDSFLQATKLNGSYAPAWYGLGRAYEATGTRRGPTKSAYQRYLTLAPSGPLAADARARIDNL